MQTFAMAALDKTYIRYEQTIYRVYTLQNIDKTLAIYAYIYGMRLAGAEERVEVGQNPGKPPVVVYYICLARLFARSDR